MQRSHFLCNPGRVGVGVIHRLFWDIGVGIVPAQKFPKQPVAAQVVAQVTPARLVVVIIREHE